MKTSIDSTESTPISDKPYIAVIFEGPWFFTEDPDDKSGQTILAICPYTDQPDHICEFVDWSDDNGVSLQGKVYGKIEEGETYRIDVTTDVQRTEQFKEVFTAAHDAYKFPYFQSTTDGVPLQIVTNPKMRRVSIPVPDAVHAAGRLENASIVTGDRNCTGITHSPSGDAVSTFVAFILVYEFEEQEAIKVVKEQSATGTGETWPIPSPHLVVRVRNPNLKDENGCQSDCSEENTHLSSSFDALRRMALLPMQQADDEYNYYCDIAIYPTAGQSLIFDRGPKEFGVDELGIPPGIGWDHVKDLASCAAGPVVGDGPP
jgi:hypothetical protein